MADTATTLLVLADPAEAQIRMLERFRDTVEMVIGQKPELFAAERKASSRSTPFNGGAELKALPPKAP